MPSTDPGSCVARLVDAQAPPRYSSPYSRGGVGEADLVLELLRQCVRQRNAGVVGVPVRIVAGRQEVADPDVLAHVVGRRPPHPRHQPAQVLPLLVHAPQVGGEPGEAGLQKRRYYLASQWRLMWWRFRKHRLAMIATPAVLVLYLMAVFAEFISPYTPVTYFRDGENVPPQWLRIYDREHGLRAPFVYGLERTRHPETFRRIYTVDKSRIVPLRLFLRAEPYRLWGLIPADRHLFGAGVEQERIFLIGTDRLGRDLFSRVMYASRISLSIGLVGVVLTFVLGTTLGGIAGYLGGLADGIIMRTVDLVISLPTIPLWMALAAALPDDWNSIQTYFAITIIFSVIGWTGLARVVRSKLLALREEEFVMAAKVAGASNTTIIARHLLPSFASYLIVSLTLSVPFMILGETALSFLGLGIRPPSVSWGTLLEDAQRLQIMAHQPWIMIPGVFVIVTVLAFNFLGDGLRDAADPYR